MKRNIQRILNVLKDPHKKPLLIILKDVLQLWVIKKEFPLYYFGRFFYRKGAQDPKNFMNLREYNKIVENLVFENNKTPELSLTLDDKLKFYKLCKTYGIPTAEVLSFNRKNSFHYNNAILNIETPKALEALLLKICEERNLSTLFLKPIDENSGKGIIKIEKNSIYINQFWDYIITSNYVIQKTVIQHPEINRIYAKSVNTMRLETFTDKEGTFNFLGHYMRFGSNGNFVDNVNQGGVYVNIDLKTGTLSKYAETNLVLGGKTFNKHPDTGVAFENFKIPFFQEAIELVKKASYYFPTYIQAWDVVITPNGPLLLEGNNYPSMITGEYSYGGYKNKPEVFKELLAAR